MRTLPTISLEFFESRVVVDPPTGCWNWTGAHNVSGRGVYQGCYVYRISYAMFVADPGDLQVNHHCDNPRCVNPDHLYAGTQQQNIADCIRRGRNFVPPPPPRKVRVPRPPRPVAPCGTRAGYTAHKRRGDERCEPCWEANRAYMRAYKLRSAA